MKRILYLIYLSVFVSFLGACRSTRHVAEEFSVDSLKQSSKEMSSAASSENSTIEETDSSDTFVWTITTEYDTSKADSTGKSPVLRTTKQLAVKHSGKKKKNETSKNENISATKEESAEQFHKNNNRREDTKAETKQPLYYSYILYGVALVILMAVLAYWVFSKYRAARPLNK